MRYTNFYYKAFTALYKNCDETGICNVFAETLCVGTAFLIKYFNQNQYQMPQGPVFNRSANIPGSQRKTGRADFQRWRDGCKPSPTAVYSKIAPRGKPEA